jgi:hypothetical protein
VPQPCRLLGPRPRRSCQPLDDPLEVGRQFGVRLLRFAAFALGGFLLGEHRFESGPRLPLEVRSPPARAAPLATYVPEAVQVSGALNKATNHVLERGLDVAPFAFPEQLKSDEREPE